MDTMLTRLVFAAGVGQLGVLIAAALVPVRLNWRDELRACHGSTGRCIFNVKEHLTAWWLKAGYFALTVMFMVFTVVYAWAAL
jgi:hypothetical protein